jgi:hypothetical protein
MDVSGQLPDVAALRSGKTLPVFIEWMLRGHQVQGVGRRRVLDETTIVSQELDLFCSRVAHFVAVLRLRSLSYTTRLTKAVEKLPHVYGEQLSIFRFFICLFS